MNKYFKEMASLSVFVFFVFVFFFLSLFIHKISSKHDGDTTASTLNLSLILLTLLHAMSGSVFGHFSKRS